MTNRVNFSQQELCDAIYSAVCNTPKPMTRAQICRAVGRAKSPHVIAMLEYLVHMGYILRASENWRRGKVRWVYKSVAVSALMEAKGEWQTSGD